MRRKRLSEEGSTLILTLGIALSSAIALFLAFSYVRMLSSQQEQTSAIGAAALVVAKDLTRIVVDDPNFGYISLSDYSACGAGVAAPDGFGLPVKSLNTIFATIRLDMIIADQMNNPLMKKAAIVDFNNALLANDRLSSALQTALKPGNTQFHDVNGNVVSIYADALAAYQGNLIRSNGKSTLVDDSLQLTLGYCSTALTQSPVPSPRSLDATLPSSAQSQGNYLPYVKAPYDGKTFVFSALSDSTHLIANDTFEVEATGVPYSLPSAIKVEADQEFSSASPSAYTVHAQACAQAGGSGFNCPAPGAIVFSFPDGCPAEITTPKSLIVNVAFTGSKIAWSKLSGDYPNGNSMVTPSPLPTFLAPYLQNNIGNSISFSLYLWLRRLGPSVNVQDAVNMINSLILPANTSNLPLLASFTFDTATAKIVKQIYYLSSIYACNSDCQSYVASFYSIAAASTAQDYDIVISLNTYAPGKTNGGAHGGEPLVDPRLTSALAYVDEGKPPVQPASNLVAAPQTALNFGWASACGGWSFGVWRMGTPPGSVAHTWGYYGGDNTAPNIFVQPTSSDTGAMRPSFQTNGVAVEIALHKLINAEAMMPAK